MMDGRNGWNGRRWIIDGGFWDSKLFRRVRMKKNIIFWSSFIITIAHNIRGFLKVNCFDLRKVWCYGWIKFVGFINDR